METGIGGRRGWAHERRCRSKRQRPTIGSYKNKEGVSMAKSKKIVKDGKTVGYVLPSGAVVKGGQGKEGYIGQIKKK